eukprot:12692882-Alexandrium_andersonii.AAC.1
MSDGSCPNLCIGVTPRLAHSRVGQLQTCNSNRVAALQAVCSSFEQFPALSSSSLLVLCGGGLPPPWAPQQAPPARAR